MDETGIVRAVTLSKLKQLCGHYDPACWGVLLSEGSLYFGVVKEGKKLLVSIEDMECHREEDDELSSLSDDEVVMLSWVATTDPVSVEWHLFSLEKVLQMGQEPDDGTVPN